MIERDYSAITQAVKRFGEQFQEARVIVQTKEEIISALKR